MSKPIDTDHCTFHPLQDAANRGVYVGINKADLFVIPTNGGFTCLGFDVAERRRRGVLAWLGKEAPEVERGTVAAYEAYLQAMRDGEAKFQATRMKCDLDLSPALKGLEGKRVEVTTPDGEKSRFWVSRSGGWMPCHIEIKSRRATGGCAVYVPEGSTVRVVPT